MPEPTVSLPAEGDETTRGAAGNGAPETDDALGPTVILPALQARQPAASETVACWFGKLPFLGDFASRRLPETFIKPWDEWLQPGLAAARDATGERWLDLYLTFPVWRFVMPAGLLGDANWIGVLLPSVDRVGRCFPLTICEPLARGTLEEAGLIGIDLRLAALANVGIEALDADSVDFLELRLADLGTMRVGTDAPAGASSAGASSAGTSLAGAALSGASSAGTSDSTTSALGGSPTILRPRAIPLEAWLQRPRPGQEPLPSAWPLCGTVPAVLAGAASRFVVAALKDRVLWWSPSDEAGRAGAMLLEPFPFSNGLLGRLIGIH